MVIAMIAGSATGTTATTATTMVIDANFFCMSRSRDQGPHHAPLLRVVGWEAGEGTLHTSEMCQGIRPEADS